ncbi:hypothetical protein Q3G72_002611 [Acer saccharum]|nr:hypothetical protein Q3G72_002611 [Acer saccharum]
MAGVLGKTNLFSYCNQNQQNKGISVFPKSCSGSCSLSSVKLKSESLRLSASLNSDFCGRRVVFQENKGLPKRGISSKSSINAQALQIGRSYWKSPEMVGKGAAIKHGGVLQIASPFSDLQWRSSNWWRRFSMDLDGDF